jgi:hypothetical protein
MWSLVLSKNNNINRNNNRMNVLIKNMLIGTGNVITLSG